MTICLCCFKEVLIILSISIYPPFLPLFFQMRVLWNVLHLQACSLISNSTRNVSNTITVPKKIHDNNVIFSFCPLSAGHGIIMASSEKVIIYYNNDVQCLYLILLPMPMKMSLRNRCSCSLIYFHLFNLHNL